MTRVKICGITTREDLELAISAGADAVGLIVGVDVETPREIPPERAAELARLVPPFVTAVLVTMPATPAAAIELASRVRPDAVQVHGSLGAGDVASLSAEFHGDVVRAVSPTEAPEYDGVADALLVDSLDERGAGGTGNTHDWTRTRELVDAVGSPVVLAGGLTPENVAEAIETVDPFAVDVASGVEAEPGRKDARAVSAFVRAATGGRP